MDPWDSEELTAVRHVGTVCAGAVALLAVLARDIPSVAGSSVLLRMATFMLLLGVAGSAVYQLTTIQARGRTTTAWRMVGAMLLVVGALGFVVLAWAVLFAV
jgi:hypothetical protein